MDYLESFCSSLSPEPSLTPFQRVMEECIDVWVETHRIVFNLDSQELEPMNEHVWDTDANEWLDNLFEELDLQTELESFENDLDFTDVIGDLNNDEWENVWNDVIDNFDSNFAMNQTFFSKMYFVCETTTNRVQ